MPTKESSLKNPRSRYVQQAYEARQDQGIPDRKMTLDPSEWVQSSDYGRTEVAATMLPALSRNWAPNGLLIIPTMSEVGAKVCNLSTRLDGYPHTRLTWSACRPGKLRAGSAQRSTHTLGSTPR